MDELRFDGQVAVVTGAGGNPGLGRAYALLLASRGAKVVVNDLGVGPDGRGKIGEGVTAVVREITDNGGEAIANELSVAERDSAEQIIGAAVDTWGRVDIVINNAGVAPFAWFDEFTDRDIERIIGVHVFGQIWMCRAAWPHMKAQGYGRIVNVSSNVPLHGIPQLSIYGTAKLGVIGLTRHLAGEGSQYGIRVNALCPVADTLNWRTLMEPAVSERARAQGLVAENVAPVAALLAHQDVPFTGKTLLARAGAVQEVFLSATAGSERDIELTPEALLDRLPQVLDRAGATAFPEPTGEPYPEGARPLPYQPEDRQPSPS
jgi:NAD(P)-dependent dehydrogenase (short-subunit alcohol dehydrogenase family)